MSRGLHLPDEPALGTTADPRHTSPHTAPLPSRISHHCGYCYCTAVTSLYSSINKPVYNTEVRETSSLEPGYCYYTVLTNSVLIVNKPVCHTEIRESSSLDPGYCYCTTVTNLVLFGE